MAPYGGVPPKDGTLYLGASASAGNTGGLFVDLTDTGAAATFFPGVPLEGVVSILNPERLTEVLRGVDRLIGSIDPPIGLSIIGLFHSGIFKEDWRGFTIGDDVIMLFDIGLMKTLSDVSGTMGIDLHETGFAADFVAEFSSDFFLSF